MYSNQHPTRRLLIETAAELLESESPDSLTVDMVLNKSGVSKGSLYHHFDDFSDLVETVLVGLFVKSVDNNADLIRGVIDQSTDLASLIAGLRGVTQATQNESQRATRFRRARLLSFAEKKPRLMARMAIEQARLTAAYAELFAICQERGWFKPDFSPHAAAVFIQAYTLGKIVDDVTEDRMNPADWDNLIMQIVAKVFVAETGQAA